MVKPTLVSQLAKSIIEDCEKIEQDPRTGMPLEFNMKQNGIYGTYSTLAANEIAEMVGSMMQWVSAKPEPELFEVYARILSIKEGRKVEPQQAQEEFVKRIQKAQNMNLPAMPMQNDAAPVFLQFALKMPNIKHEQAQALVEKWSTLIEALSEVPAIQGDMRISTNLDMVKGILEGVVDQVNQQKYFQGSKNLFRPEKGDPNANDNGKPGTKLVPVNDKTLGDKVKSFSSAPELDKYIEEFKDSDDPYTFRTGNVATKDAMKELDRLIGLDEVKDEIKKLRALMLMHAAKKKMGVLKEGHEHAMHLVFTGNPGTGKTTVARLVGQMYKDLGILKSGHVVSVGRQDLVAGFIGQSEEKTKKKIEEAMGGVLFIDEAYALKRGGDDGKDFGNNVIDVLIQAMEDHRDELVVIVAGYPEPMKRFISSNPGLESRFNKYIEFKNYSGQELGQIFDLMLSDRGMTITDDGRNAAIELFTQESQRANEKFGNGRFVRNFVEKLEQEQAMRMSTAGQINRKVVNDEKLSPETHAHLLRIEVEDVQAVKMKSILKENIIKTGPGAIQIVTKPKP